MAEPTVPTRKPLTRDRIFAAALEIIDHEGLAALSMRRLGAALGVEAMAIYHHVPNKDALLAGVVDLLLAPGGVIPEGTGWREGLQWGADTLRTTLLAHPAAVALVTSSPLRSDPSIEWIERPLVLLADAGFTPDDAAGLLHAVLALSFGWITFEGASLRPEGVARELPADPGPGAPTAAALASRMNDWSPGFHEAIDAMLDSWSRRLPPGSKGAHRTVRPTGGGGSAWIVEKSGNADKAHKKGKGGKKKDKGKKRV